MKKMPGMILLLLILSITTKAETINGLQIDPKFDSCKVMIEEAFKSLQSFNKEFDIAAFSKKTLSQKENDEISKRTPTWVRIRPTELRSQTK